MNESGVGNLNLSRVLVANKIGPSAVSLSVLRCGDGDVLPFSTSMGRPR